MVKVTLSLFPDGDKKTSSEGEGANKKEAKRNAVKRIMPSLQKMRETADNLPTYIDTLLLSDILGKLTNFLELKY